MKKTKLLLGALGLLSVLVSCGPKVQDYDGTEVQGVSETEILVGNTAATTGAFATVGVPFNAGIEMVLADYNAAGGFNGKTVRLVHYDDGFDGAKGLTFTKKLVEEDKIFSLVGHFGTNTVTQTVDYIKEKGIPMVYAATGISELYQEGAKGFNRAVMSVQPIFDAEGRVLLARAFASTEGGMGLGATKVGVISTTDDAGTGMLSGVKRQAQELSKSAKIVYTTTSAEQGTDHSAAVNKLKLAGCDVVVIAANQVPCSEILGYMKAAEFNAKVITSYVSANAQTLGTLVDAGTITAQRPVYTTAWLDVTSPKLLDRLYYTVNTSFLPVERVELTTAQVAELTEASFSTAAAPYFVSPTGTTYYAPMMLGFSEDYWDFACSATRNGQGAYAANSYAMAGYIAGKLFVQGLERVQQAGKQLTWKNYIEEMENGALNIAMGGTISYANGNRFGVTDLALNTIGLEADATGAHSLVSVSGIKTLDAVMSAVKAELKK